VRTGSFPGIRAGDSTGPRCGWEAIRKVVEKPRSTLQHFYLRSEDLEGLQRIPAFPLTSSQLAKYDLKYLGKEQVDEIDCYIFQAKPKVVERVKAYFDGVVWVDAKYLEVVKHTEMVTDQGDVHTLTDLPFSLSKPIAKMSTENTGSRATPLG